MDTGHVGRDYRPLSHEQELQPSLQGHDVPFVWTAPLSMQFAAEASLPHPVLKIVEIAAHRVLGCGIRPGVPDRRDHAVKA